jgi:hypothetical protein
MTSNAYTLEHGYLPSPGPQGLPHLPPVGQETGAPPGDAWGPGAVAYGYGNSATNPSTVVVSSLSPSTGAQSAAVATTITGTGFEASPTVTVSGTGVTVSGVSRTDSKHIAATFTMSAGATVANRTVTVTNADGGSGSKTNAFDVTAP